MRFKVPSGSNKYCTNESLSSFLAPSAQKSRRDSVRLNYLYIGNKTRKPTLIAFVLGIDIIIIMKRRKQHRMVQIQQYCASHYIRHRLRPLRLLRPNHHHSRHHQNGPRDNSRHFAQAVAWIVLSSEPQLSQAAAWRLSLRRLRPRGHRVRCFLGATTAVNPAR